MKQIPFNDWYIETYYCDYYRSFYYRSLSTTFAQFQRAMRSLPSAPWRLDDVLQALEAPGERMPSCPSLSGLHRPACVAWAIAARSSHCRAIAMRWQRPATQTRWLGARCKCWWGSSSICAHAVIASPPDEMRQRSASSARHAVSDEMRPRSASSGSTCCCVSDESVIQVAWIHACVYLQSKADADTCHMIARTNLPSRESRAGGVPVATPNLGLFHLRVRARLWMSTSDGRR